MWKLIVLIGAIICFVVFTLAAHGTVDTTEGNTWLGAGFILFAGSFLPLK